MNLLMIRQQLERTLSDYFETVQLPEGSIFVLGCSTSEICGRWKGTESSLVVGETVIKTLQPFLNKRHINLAVQGCEHINRALLVEQTVAKQNGLEIVSVKPAMYAGGGAQVAAYRHFKNPVEVEHVVAAGGLDLGGTEIGMHVKFVQIPVRLAHREVGEARAVGLSSRPKLIGGERAQYSFTTTNLVE
ncbi:TIGR01440 family protein [Furfurilactobacillus sp. WILCCON 0119]